MTNETMLTGHTIDLIPSVLDALKDNDKTSLVNIFDHLEASEIAHLLESLPDSYRGSLWRFIPEDRNGDVLVHLGDVARVSLATYLDNDQVIEAFWL